MSFGFSVGDVVLVQWRDGKIYFAKIRRIDEKRRQCAIMFDDNSRGDATFDQIHSVNETTTDWIVCVICKGGDSEAPNEIVLCDKCGIGFHQQCHKPSIPSHALEPDAPWMCAYCLSGEVNPYWKPKDNPFQGGRRSSAASYRLTKRRRMSQGGRTKSQSSTAEKESVSGKPSFYRGRHSRDNTKLQLLEASRAPNFIDDVFSPVDQGSDETTPSMEDDIEQTPPFDSVTAGQAQTELPLNSERKDIDQEDDGEGINGMPDLERFPTPEADDEHEQSPSAESTAGVPHHETVMGSPPPPALISPSPDHIIREKSGTVVSPPGGSVGSDTDTRGHTEATQTLEELATSNEHFIRDESSGQEEQERRGLAQVERTASTDNRDSVCERPLSGSPLPSNEHAQQPPNGSSPAGNAIPSPDRSHSRNQDSSSGQQRYTDRIIWNKVGNDGPQAAVKTEKRWDSRYGTVANTSNVQAIPAMLPAEDRRQDERNTWSSVMLNPNAESPSHSLPVVSAVQQRRPERPDTLQASPISSLDSGNKSSAPGLSPTSAVGTAEEGRGYVILAPSGRDLNTISGQRGMTQGGPVQVSDAELRGSERQQRIVRPYSTVIPRTHTFNNTSGSRRRYAVRRGYRSSRWSPPGRYIANRLGEPPQFVTDVRTGEVPSRREAPLLHSMAASPGDNKASMGAGVHELGNTSAVSLRGLPGQHLHGRVQQSNPMTAAYRQEMRYGPVSGLIHKVSGKVPGRPAPAGYVTPSQHNSTPGKVVYHPMPSGDQRYYDVGKAGAAKRSHTAIAGPDSTGAYSADSQRDTQQIRRSAYHQSDGVQPSLYHHYPEMRAPPAKRRPSITPASLSNSSLEQLVMIFNEEFERFVGSFGYRVRLRPSHEHHPQPRQAASAEDERSGRYAQAPMAAQSTHNFTVMHTERPQAQVVPGREQSAQSAYSSRGTEAARAAALEVAAEAMRLQYHGSSPDPDKSTAGMATAPCPPGESPVVRSNGTGGTSARRREPSGHLCVACLRQAVFVCSKCQRTWYCSRECQLKVWKRYCANCN